MDTTKTIKEIAASPPVHNSDVDSRLQSGIDETRQQLLILPERIKFASAPGTVDTQDSKVELISRPAIALAVRVAQKVYGDRFKGKSFPPSPSVEQVNATIATKVQQEEITGRTEPTLRFLVEEDKDGTLHYRTIILDGAQKMPLETYEDNNVYDMTRAKRALASRMLIKDSHYRRELDHEDMTVYNLLAHGAAMQGKPIDQYTCSMLTAKFMDGDEYIWDADWSNGRSSCGEYLANRADRRLSRLRFAVWGDVIA